MIAIDFGTTNSSVAVFTEGDAEPRVQQVEPGDPDSYNPNVIPSAVCSCRSEGCKATAVRFGHDALRHHFDLNHDSRILHEMKLYFDRATQEPATLVEVRKGTLLREEAGVLTPVPRIERHRRYEGEVPLDPRDYVPGTAEIIRELLRRSRAARQDMEDLVIGVPASFGELGKRHLREATSRAVFGDHAKYEAIHMYGEPVAAARAYMHLHPGNMLVLDYGGGTLDITVLSIREPNQFRDAIRGIAGFPEGGSCMDDEILRHCLAAVGREAEQWYEEQPVKTKLQVKRNVEKAKIELSRTREARVTLPGSPFAPVRLTRELLSFALQPITTRMAVKVTETLEKAVGGIGHINFVVMSGGTSLNPVVQRAVMAMFKHLSRQEFVLPDAADPASVETSLCAVARGLAWLRKDGAEEMTLPPIRAASATPTS